MFRIHTSLAVMALALLGCDGSSTSPSPPTPPQPPALQISGHVSRFVVVPTQSGRFADINYEVTVMSSRATSGCFVRVNWLDGTGLQIGFTFVATDVSIPAGTSTLTNQDFEEIGVATSIRDSRVEFSLCS